MSIEKHIRQMAGMTQQEMAEYLSVPLSTYAMSELKQRELKPEKMRKLNQLFAELKAQRAIPYSALVNENTTLNGLKTAIEQTEAQIIRCKWKLENMMQHHKQNLRRKRTELYHAQSDEQIIFNPSEKQKLEKSILANGDLQQILNWAKPRANK